MFLDSKYTKWYFSIIESAKRRDGSYTKLTESHHIIPKSFGGGDSADNLANLTPREHYICHWLLTKMTVGEMKMKMSFALHTFFHFNKHRRLNFNSRQYEFHKQQYKLACKQRIPHTKNDVFRFKHQKTGEEFVGTRSEFSKHSALNGQAIYWLVKHCINPEDPKKLIRGWGIWVDSLGIYSYDKHRPAYGVQNLPDVVCEHCNKKISTGNYRRWHGDRCKLKDPKGHYDRTRQVAGINQHR